MQGYEFHVKLINSDRWAIVDVEDAPKVLAMGSWRLRPDGYVEHVSQKARRMGCTPLARLIAGKPPKGWVIDHVNQNKLDNRRSNLMQSSYSANAWNKAAHTSRVGGCRGITWNANTRRWKVSFIQYGTTYALGTYESLLEAKAAGTLAMAILYGRRTQFYDDCLVGRNFDEVVRRGPKLFAFLPGKAGTRIVEKLRGAVHPDALRLYLGI